MKTPIHQALRFLTKHRTRILSGLAVLTGMIESLPEPAKPRRILKARSPRKLNAPKN